MSSTASVWRNGFWATTSTVRYVTGPISSQTIILREMILCGWYDIGGSGSQRSNHHLIHEIMFDVVSIPIAHDYDDECR